MRRSFQHLDNSTPLLVLFCNILTDLSSAKAVATKLLKATRFSPTPASCPRTQVAHSVLEQALGQVMSRASQEGGAVGGTWLWARHLRASSRPPAKARAILRGTAAGAQPPGLLQVRGARHMPLWASVCKGEACLCPELSASLNALHRDSSPCGPVGWGTVSRHKEDDSGARAAPRLCSSYEDSPPRAGPSFLPLPVQILPWETDPPH